MTVLELLQTTPLAPFVTDRLRAGYLIHEFEDMTVLPDPDKTLFCLDLKDGDSDVFYIKVHELKDWFEGKTERLETYAPDARSVKDILSMSVSRVSLYLYSREWIAEEALRELTWFGTNTEQIDKNKKSFIEKIDCAVKEAEQTAEREMLSEEEVLRELRIRSAKDVRTDFERDFEREMRRIELEAQQKKRTEIFRQEYRYLQQRKGKSK